MSATKEDIARSNVQAYRREAKGKERDDGFERTPSSSTSSEHVDEMAYPPTTDDAEETRRVEETLRRWEIAERQRRKAARGSISSPPSLVGDVSRRASLLWSGRKSVENHSAQDTLPLTQIEASPTPSPTRSEAHSAADPFATPQDSLSPFADPQGSSSGVTHIIPVLSRPPPPKPLNLPPPRTPPPIIDTQDPTSPSTSKEDIRWWHDWLCGCGEGPDRGGDFQAGRTNPFE